MSSGGPKGTKRRKKHAERAEEVEALAERLAVFEDWGAFVAELG